MADSPLLEPMESLQPKQPAAQAPAPKTLVVPAEPKPIPKSAVLVEPKLVQKPVPEPTPALKVSVPETLKPVSLPEQTKKGPSSLVNTNTITQGPAPLPPHTTHQNHRFWGFAWIILGFGCLYFCLLANAVQIQTTKYWFAGKRGSLILSFNLLDYQTILPTQNMDQHLMLACLFAWFQQLIQFTFSIGLDLHQLMGKKKASVYLWFSAFYVIMNSLADLNFGGMYSDWWQPWLLAGSCFMVSFYFGLGAINLIIKGFRMVLP